MGMSSVCMGSMAAATNVDDAALRASTATSRRWRASLASGLRAALACTIVGVVSVYSPLSLRRHLTFPAFSYVVTVIIVTDATVGTAVRAAASALHATVMGAVPSVVALWLAHRTGAGESVPATAAVVALSTFAVALPESPGPVAKRIALGQIIIIYVAKFRRGERPDHELVLLHPANVVACTALGVVAALLAVLLPWPRLAIREVAEKSRAYMETAAERVRVLVDAFILTNNDTTTSYAAAEEEDDDDADLGNRRRRRWYMAAYMSQANRLASESTVLLQRLNSVKGDVRWERAGAVGEADLHHLHDRIEVPIRGMEMALSSSCLRLRRGMWWCCSSSSSSWVQLTRDQIRLSLLTTHYTGNTGGSLMVKPKLIKPCGGGGGSWAMEQMAAAERHEDLAPFLFLFCMDLLHRGGGGGKASPCKDLMPDTATAAAAAAQGKVANSKVTPAATHDEDRALHLSDQESQVTGEEEEEEEDQQDDHDVEEEEEEQDERAYGDECDQANKTSSSSSSKKKKKKIVTSSGLLRRERVLTAAKCAFSLGLAVLLGLLFNNDHGFWSGLIVATTMTSGRDSTWATGVARAHGTAVGSVYGVLACLAISQRRSLMELRFLALLPWILLSTFLKRNRAYGPAGGVAAALSGVIIVGRSYDEPPMAFTITRLVETFIGLACTVAADLVFQPNARPSALTRAQLARCITALRQCCTEDGCASSKQLKKMQQQVTLLSKCVAESRREPSFLWLPPFPAACYDKVHGSLSRMAQLLGLYLLARAAGDPSTGGTLGDDVSQFHSLLSDSVKEIAARPSFEYDDVEAGRSRTCYEPELLLQSFLVHAKEALHEEEDADEQKKLALCLGSIGFCMGEMMKEAHQLEAHMLELRLAT